MATNVPPVTFGATGFVMPTEEQILAGCQADINAAFGGNLNPALNTPQGQLATSMAALIAGADEDFLYYTTQTDPAYAQGRMQDAIGRIYFMQRFAAEPTILQVQCVGQGVTIPVNALIQDGAGNTYYCMGSGVIPLTGGSITLQFANLVPGPIPVPVGGLTIYSALPGWDVANLVSGEVGNNTETQSQFESRRAASVAVNSVGTINAIQGAVLALPGVLDCYVTENDSSGTATIGGVQLLPNSLYVSVVGGSAMQVAQAIWSKKPPGPPYNGNTTVTYTDNNPGFSPPYPTYQVTWNTPSVLPVFYTVTIKNSPSVPANALALVQNQLLLAFAGGTFGNVTIPKARIGSVLYAPQYTTPVAVLGPWAQITALGIGSPNAPIAQFTGSCGGTSLHVVTLVSGSLGIGDWIVSGSGVTGTAAILNGTQILAQVSGTTGGVGFYTLSMAQIVPLQTLFDVNGSGSVVAVNINQSPQLTAGQIQLVLI